MDTLYELSPLSVHTLFLFLSVKIKPTARFGTFNYAFDAHSSQCYTFVIDLMRFSLTAAPRTAQQYEHDLRIQCNILFGKYVLNAIPLAKDDVNIFPRSCQNGRME